MIIVGELINSSRKAIKEAIDKGDIEYIKKIAVDQEEAGATYIDVNAGTFVGTEIEHLKWMIENIQQVVDIPCCIDSPDPKALEAALKVHKGTAMINSISLEEDRYDAVLPVVAGTDPLVQPIGTDDTYGFEFLDSVAAITTQFKGVHTMCGLSNISFGLPERKYINRNFAVMAIARGLDGLIINPLDRDMMGSIVTAEMLAGRDEFCAEYLQAFRAGIIGNPK